MEKFLKLVENPTWYMQFLYGAILALFFGGITLYCEFNFFWAVVQVTLISAVREHYNEHLEGEFNWRNFFFLITPVILAGFFF